MPISFASLSGGGGSTPPMSRVEVFDSSTTWAHPDGYDEPRLIKALILGGGGGGGTGGIRGSVYNDDNAGGGAGGGSGYLREVEFYIQGDLNIIVGAGGSGGNGVSYTYNNFSNNNRAGRNGSSGASGGQSSIEDTVLGWTVFAEGGGGGGGGSHSQNQNSGGGVSGGSYGYAGASSGGTDGTGGLGGSPGGGRYRQGLTGTNQNVNQIYGQTPRSFDHAFDYGPGNNNTGAIYSFLYNNVDYPKHLSHLLPGGGAAGSGRYRNSNNNTFNISGGAGFFGTGGDAAPNLTDVGQPGTGRGSGGGGSHGFFFRNNGTFNTQDAGDGQPGRVIIYY